MDINLWKQIESEIHLRIDAEPSLGPFLDSLVLSQKDLLSAVASILASKLHSDALSAKDIRKFILDVYRDCEEIGPALEDDLKFFKEHDPACRYFSTPLLFYKGFLGLASSQFLFCNVTILEEAMQMKRVGYICTHGFNYSNCFRGCLW